MSDGLCKIGFGYRSPVANISEFSSICMCEEVYFESLISWDKYAPNATFNPLYLRLSHNWTLISLKSWDLCVLLHITFFFQSSLSPYRLFQCWCEKCNDLQRAPGRLVWVHSPAVWKWGRKMVSCSSFLKWKLQIIRYSVTQVPYCYF